MLFQSSGRKSPDRASVNAGPFFVPRHTEETNTMTYNDIMIHERMAAGIKATAIKRMDKRRQRRWPQIILWCVAAAIFVSTIGGLAGSQPGGIIIAAFLFACVVYFIPTYVAVGRRHPNLWPIFLLNLFLGWILLGWVAALVWASATFTFDGPHPA